MKNNAKYLLLLIFLAVISFIVWDKSQSTSLNQVENKTFLKKIDKIYLEPAIDSQFKPHIKLFYEDNKVQYSLISDKNMAEMAIISQKDNFSLDKIEEITKNYHPTYIKKNYNTWEAETKTIYFYSKTANNHFGNQGKKGMNYTMDFLTENQINYSGAGTNLTKARRPTLIDVNGSKIAFLSYEGVDSTPQNYVADATSSGFAKWNLNTLALDIKNAKNEKAEFIIVSMHAGTEYKYLPRDDQKDFARKTIDLGADLVIGHHPHRIQTFENYHGKMIFYSLGNLVFDQMWSEQTKQGMVIKFEFVSNQIKSFQIIPVYIENYQQPRFCSQNEA